jgi:hypothetical protein
MDPLQLLSAVAVLAGTLCFGTVAHECAHAAALRAAGIDCEMQWLADWDAVGVLRASVLGTWASVTPRGDLDQASPLGLRVAALAPLALVTPFALVAVGVLPDPTASGDPRALAAALAWMACALPSPQDFSVVWYAEQAAETYANDSSATEAAH